MPKTMRVYASNKTGIWCSAFAKARALEFDLALGQAEQFSILKYQPFLIMFKRYHVTYIKAQIKMSKLSCRVI